MSGPGGDFPGRRPGSRPDCRRRMGSVAGGTSRKFRTRGTGVRAHAPATLLAAALTAVLLSAAVERYGPIRAPTLDGDVFGSAGADNYGSCRGVVPSPTACQLWAAEGRRTLRLSQQASRGWWLLLLLSLSGNTDYNPGPDLRIYSQNVNSLKGKLGTLRTHAGELAGFDALCLVETKMAPGLPSDSELQLGLGGYTWFRRDRTANGGGVACAVKASLSPVHRPDLETDCESLVVQLGTSRAAYLAVCYRPPSQNQAMQKIADLLRGLHATGRPFLLTGDLNLPELTWDAGEPTYRSRTARAELFIDALTACEAEQSVAAPTRGGNFLDLVVSRGGAVDSKVRGKIFDADHEALETHFTADLGAPPRATRTRVYNYKRADFAKLRQSLRLLPWNLLTDLDVNEATLMFYDLTFEAIQDCVPLIELRRKFPPWYDRTVRDLLKRKEKAQKRKKVSPTEENIRAHSAARAEFKRHADQSYRSYLLGLIREFKDNPKRYWSFVKSLKSCASASPVLEWGGRAVTDLVARANVFNACFAKKFSAPHAGPLPEPPVLNAPGLSTFVVPPGRVAQLLRELSPHKACGPDGLSARIMHECADELAIPLEIICNLSVRSGVFPTIWKRANVIPVYKKGSKKLPENYRPVSLLAISSKVLEKVVCEGLLRACLPALPDSQHGFLPKRSCVTNLTCFMDHCWLSLAKGLQTDAIYTDYSSAFTSVSHRLLLHKLRHSFNITGLAHSWIDSYLSHRSQRVILDGKHSDWIPVQSGVPEGSILGPILFSCYVADLPSQIQTSSLSYADDVKIFHRIQCPADVHSLQADLNRLSDWSKTWHLKLNPAKCKSVTFTLRTSPIASPYFLDGQELERCTQISDLGVVLDSRLTFGAHVDACVSKANRMLGLLMRSMQVSHRARLPYFDHRAVMAAYNAHVRSTLEYASVIWSGAAPTHLARLERLQHRFLMWLGAKTHSRCSMDYDSLLRHFRCTSIKARFVQTDLKYLHSVFAGRLDCGHLVSMFSLHVPGRRSRQTGLFNVPFGRVDTVKNGLTVRIPKLVNDFLCKYPGEDIFLPTRHYITNIRAYSCSLGTYMM